MVKFFKNVSKGLVSVCLASTLLIGMGCAKVYTEKPKIKADSLAVLVIDMQDCWLKDVDEDELEIELPYQADVLDYCKNNNIPVFVIEYKNCGPTTYHLKKKIDLLHERDYITKEGRNAFEDTDLEERLKSASVKTVILMGVYASACVEDTARGALRAGFKIATSKDLIADGKNDTREEDIGWYKKRGLYKDSYKELLNMIEK